MSNGVPAATLRPEAEVAASGIVEVFNLGRGRQGLIPLYVGEGDLPTPNFIGQAASAAIAAGETFYSHQRGLPALRQALADYHTRLYGRPFDAERFFVTAGGMHAIQVAARMVAGSGDEVLIPTPAWPNITAAVAITGARPVSVPMRFSEASWRLDLDRLFDAASPRTKAIFLNSPANPTGWAANLEEIKAVSDFADDRGLWLIADEVYQRLFYGAPRAPSLYDLGEPGERVLFVNTFSKNWAMTGWRIGWLAASPKLGDAAENLIQYSTSGVAAFMQRAAAVALADGEAFVAAQLARARQGRTIVIEGLRATGRARFAEPAGAFYLFFAIDGQDDTRGLALRLVEEAGVGLAPGTAFGEGGAPFLRLCFARDGAQLREAMRRLAAWLGKR